MKETMTIMNWLPNYHFWEQIAGEIGIKVFTFLISVHLCLLQVDRLFSPTTVMERQMGNIFEYSTLLCSFLIGSGYDAYVVSGYATREFCVCDQTRVVCPYLPDFTQVNIKAIMINLYD